MAKLEPGQQLRFAMDAPLWDRKYALHFRSPRGPKGASLGYAPVAVAQEIAERAEDQGDLQAIVLSVQPHNDMLQLIVALAPAAENIGTITALPDIAARIERALAAAPKLPVYVPRLYSAGLVGEQHYQAAVRRCRPGDSAALVPEPSNRHDGRAIMAKNARGELIGYLPRESWLHRVILDERQEMSASIRVVEDRGEGFLQVVLYVVVGSPEDLAASIAAEPEDYHATIDVNVREGSSDASGGGEFQASSGIPAKVWGVIGFGLILILGYCSNS
jgi:hypothetical protein